MGLHSVNNLFDYVCHSVNCSVITHKLTAQTIVDNMTSNMLKHIFVRQRYIWEPAMAKSP